MADENIVTKLKGEIRKLKAELAEAKHLISIYEDFFKGVSNNG